MLRLRTLWTSLSSMLVLVANAASAQTAWKVDPGAPTDPNNPNYGKIWSLAYPHLQDALSDTRLQLGDEIWVAAGVYKPSVSMDPNDDPNDTRLYTFRFPKGINVYGGFIGYDDDLDPNTPPFLGETMRTQRRPEFNLTILDGDIAGDDNDANFPFGGTYADNAYHVVTFEDVPLATRTKLSGFVIQHGRAEIIPGLSQDDQGNGRGGGVLVRESKNGPTAPLLERLVVRYNYAAFGGGGMQLSGKSDVMYVANCRFENNAVDGSEIDAHGLGGGVLAFPHGPIEQLYVQNCVFWRNRILDGLGGGAAAANVTFSNCTFVENHAEHSERPAAWGLGDAFFCPPSFSSTITNSIVWDNATHPLLGSPNVTYSDIEGEPNVVDPNAGPLYFWYDLAGNIQADPLFIDPLNGDVRVKGFAPVVDAGVDVPPPSHPARLHRR